jgi:isoleucyl-tRNA synthetase
MALVRRIVELGRAARASSNVRTRQPLARALVSAPGWSDLPAALITEIAEELNVRSIEPLGEEAGLVDITVKPNFRELGSRFGNRTPAIAAAISQTTDLVPNLRSHGNAMISVDGEQIEITAGDVIITESPQEGWAVASDSEDSVAIDLHIDDDLRQAGLARELVRAIQETRKVAGLDITDRITIGWASDDADIQAVFDQYGEEIAHEVLATSILQTTESPEPKVTTDLPVLIGIQRASAAH